MSDNLISKDNLVGDELKKQMLSGRPHVRS